MPSNEVKNKLFSLKTAKKIIVLLIFVIAFDYFLFPAPAMAAKYEDPPDSPIIQDQLTQQTYQENQAKLDDINQYKAAFTNDLPEADILAVKRYSYHEITAYNSEVSQCDGDPCTTANGFNLCKHDTEDSIAANFLPFGTKVRIPDLFGDRVFIVRDRMNARYPNRVDIWFKDKTAAKKFGIKVVKIEILE